MKTSKKQTLQNIEGKLILFPVDSLASHTLTLGSEEARKMTATSGQRCSELYARYNHVSLWAKTLVDLLLGTTEWYSTKLLLTWKMKGMRHKRFIFQLVGRTPHTKDFEFGLWPTPNTIERGRPEIAEQMRDANLPLYTRRNKEGTQRQFSITDYAIYKNMLPTPMAQNRETTLEKTLERKEKYGGEKRAMYLENYAAMGLLPTPTAGSDHQTQYKQGGRSLKNYMSHHGMLPKPIAQSSRGNTSDKRGKGNLTDQIAELELTTSKTSQLNPLFVAEMMGFPINWTVLPFQSGETNPSKDTEMP
jgi:hypothetical protein